MGKLLSLIKDIYGLVSAIFDQVLKIGDRSRGAGRAYYDENIAVVSRLTSEVVEDIIPFLRFVREELGKPRYEGVFTGRLPMRETDGVDRDRYWTFPDGFVAQARAMREKHVLKRLQLLGVVEAIRASGHLAEPERVAVQQLCDTADAIVRGNEAHGTSRPQSLIQALEMIEAGGGYIDPDTARRLYGPGLGNDIEQCEHYWLRISRLDHELKTYFYAGKRPVSGYSGG